MNESPQKENGHVDIANEIVEALARTSFSSYESRILWCIFRKTYGWQKKEDWISISQFKEMTGLHPSHISRSLKLLIQKKIVTKGGNKIAFNKFYSQWCELPKGVNTHHAQKVTKGGLKVTKGGNSELPKGAYTIDNPTIDTKQKTIVAKATEAKGPHPGVQAIIDCMVRTFGTLDDTKAKNRQYAWLLLKKAKMQVQPCLDLIRATSQHDFWKSKVTRVETIYKNAHKITNDLREQQTKQPPVVFIS